MSINLKLILLILIGQTISALNFGQENVRIFEAITIEDGLSQNTVQSIVQDKHGFLWFGTEAGLDRYDGHTIKEFKFSPTDPNSLSDSWIHKLYLDKDGNLWVGTNNGINLFDRAKNEFKNYLDDYSEAESLKPIVINDIIQDLNGAVLAATSKGLFKFNGQKFEFIPVPAGTKNIEINFTSLAVDSNGVMWLGTENRGLIKFNTSNQSTVRYIHSTTDKHSIAGEKILFISIDYKNNLWIGLDNVGIDYFNQSSQVFTHYNTNSTTNNIPTNRVRSILKKSRTQYWIGTFDNGLFLWNTETKAATNYKHDKYNKRSLSNNIVLSIYKDHSGILWAGTSGGGVNKSQVSLFQIVEHKINRQNTLSNNLIWSFKEDSDGNIYTGTSDGLNIFDKKLNHLKTIKNELNSDKIITQNTIWAIAIDEKGDVWFGTGDGLNKLSKSTNKIAQYYFDKNPLYTLRNNRVQTLLYDSQKKLWVGTKNGIFKLDTQTSSYEYIDSVVTSGNDIKLDETFVLFEDFQKNIWVGTRDKGLIKYDRINNEYFSLTSKLNDPSTLSSNDIISIQQSKDSSIWIGTPYGLNKINPLTFEVKQYHVSDGLPDEVIYGIIEDEHNYLWVSTNNGICRFYPSANEFKTYTVNDGLQSNEFNVGAYLKLKSGKLLFGGINGFNAFDPEKMEATRAKPQIQFTGIKKFDKELLLDKSLQETSLIQLAHDENYFTIEFALLDFTSPRTNSYYYSITDSDKGWIDIGNKHDITFTNLAAGEYNLRIKGITSDGVESINTSKIKIIIEPVFWSTWWFRIIAIVFFAMLLFFGHKYRMRSVRTRNDLLERIIDQKTKDLRITNRELIFAKEELATEKEELTTTLKSIADGVISINHFGTITLANQAAEEILQKSNANLLGKNIIEVLLPEKKDGCKVNPEQCIKDFMNKWQNKIFKLSIEDESKIININSAEIISTSEEHHGYVIVLKDVTKKVKLENQLAMSQKMESIGQLAAGIAHEINTPMQYVGDNTSFFRDSFSVIFGYLSEIRVKLIEKYGDDSLLILDETSEECDLDFVLEEIPEALNQSDIGIQKVSKIVKAMKDFAHLGEKKKTYNNINHGIEVTSTISKNEWKYHSKLELKLENSLPEIYCLQDELNQAILNMIINSVHSIEEKYKGSNNELGQIVIETSYDDEYVTIKISDNGNGIPEKYLTKIFDPFFTTKEVGKGSGQGLSIAHDVIVNKHRGNIEVNSVIGKGTNIVITLPIHENESITATE